MASKKATTKATKSKTDTAVSSKTYAPKTRPASAKPAKKSLTRAQWGLIWLAVALLGLLALLPIDGVVLQAFSIAATALLGAGGALLPFALLGLALLLLRTPKGPVRLRGACVLLLPVLVGALLYAFSGAPEGSGADALVQSNMPSMAGGLLAGGLYRLLRWALSWVGAVIVLVLALLASVLGIVQMRPKALLDYLRPLIYEGEDDEEEDEQDDEERQPSLLSHLSELSARHKNKREQSTARKKRQHSIDIPLDEPDLEGEEAVLSAYDDDLSLPFERQDTAEIPLMTDPTPDIPLSDKRSRAQEDTWQPAQDEPTASQPRPLSLVPKPEPQAQDEQAQIEAQISQSQAVPAPVYHYPPIDLLPPPRHTSHVGTEAELRERSGCLLDTLKSFKIDAQIIGIVRGPSVTRFELNIPRGVKIERITSLADNIALSLGAVSALVSPIPDKMAVGIEVPNKKVTPVLIRECIGAPAFAEASSSLSFALGKDITGKPVIADIAEMPHMLIAGTTGSGKSVCINSMLISLLYKSTPEQVRLIMVDPKMVELGNYNGIPHLLIPVVTDAKKAAGALNWAVGEMERRYQQFAANQVRNLAGYNKLMQTKREQAMHEQGGAPEQYQVLPQIVIVIDELADLMMVAAKEVEISICRIAQKARAAGMHLVVATQRPSSKVITGDIKTNIASRIAFAVSSRVDSSIILDTTGADKLIGKGDMLYLPHGASKPLRVQGCFISSDEIEAVIDDIKQNSTVEYNEEILEHIERQAEQGEGKGSGAPSAASEAEDPLIEDAIELIMQSRQASTSMLQRRLGLGHPRASRLIDQIEERGLIGPSRGAKPREIFITRDEWNEMKLRRRDA